MLRFGPSCEKTEKTATKRLVRPWPFSWFKLGKMFMNAELDFYFPSSDKCELNSLAMG
jgi:hypothetical protein